MSIIGFDAKVAAAHGYTIVTGPDGVQQSVPVNQNAQALAGVVAPQGRVNGSCGTSFVEARKTNNDAVFITTGYTVSNTVAVRVWNVSVQSVFSGTTLGFSGGGTSSTWSASGATISPGRASQQ